MKIKYSILLMSLAFFLASCEKDYDSFITTVTPAPVMELIGGNPIVLFKGTPYVEQGIHAIEIVNGDTTELTYEILNEVNVNVPGTYKLQYKVTNSEGYDFYISRKVDIVSFTGYDVFEIPAGTYAGIRVGRGGGDVEINKLAPGVYQISDLLGGYYDQYVGYGPDYAAPGLLVISEDGSIRSELGYTSGFGTDVVGTNIAFDVANNVMTYKTTLVAYSFSFDVKLTLK